jgi:CHAT domain-containing protein/tetratricopeptide (TPR) repeat protein
MINAVPTSLTPLVDEWLACPPSDQIAWLEQHRAELTLAFLEQVKARSDALLLADPPAAETISRGACLVATYLPNEPRAHALACWARGNWAIYHNPNEALPLYQQALTVYQTLQSPQITLRLLSNLMSAAFQIGDFSSAQQSYQQAIALKAQLYDDEQIFLLMLLQNYGVLLHEAGDFPAALAAHARARTLATTLLQTDYQAEIDVNTALTLASLGRLADCEALLLQSRTISQQFQNQITLARIDMNLGELYAALGRPADALTRLQAARRQFSALENPMEVGSVLLREAALFSKIGAFAAARRCYAAAQAEFTTQQMWPQVGHAFLQGAIAQRMIGDYTKAAELLTAAEQLWQRLEQPAWLAAVRLEWITLTLTTQQAEQAYARLQSWFPQAPSEEHVALLARYHLLLGEIYTQLAQQSGEATLRLSAANALQQALALSSAQADLYLQRQAWAVLGRLHEPRDPGAAHAYYMHALACDDQIRQALSVQELKAAFLSYVDDLLPVLVRLAVEQGAPTQALTYAWRQKGSALLDLLAATTPTNELSDSLAVQIEETRAALATLRWQYAQRNANTVESLAEPGDPAIRQLEAGLNQLRQQRNRAQNTEHHLYDSSIPLQRMKADGLIEYVRCGDQLLAICADQYGVRNAVWLGQVDEFLDLADELTLALQNVLALAPDQRHAQQAILLAECQQWLGECHHRLVAPLDAWPPSSRLLIALCDPLYGLPFAAFWDGEHYLVESHLLQFTPTAALLSAPPPPNLAPGPPLIIAATAEEQLVGVQAEAETIRTIFPTSTYLLDDPSALQRLRQLPSAPQFLHLAAHTLVREDAPLFTALQLPGGLLTVEQSYELPLAGTQLVTLSGCTTAAGMESGGALLAWQSALLVAGAQAVLSTLWPIDDTVTVTWMRYFYTAFHQGATPAQAVQQTQQALIRQPEFSHPVLWAAFACTVR